jgi:hypothetical protein
MGAKSDTVAMIQEGRVSMGTTRSRMPSERTWFGRGVLPHAEDTLAAMREVATRCVPWVRVYVGPRLWSIADSEEDFACRSVVADLPDGRKAYEHNGVALLTKGAIMVSAKATLPWVMATLHHEIWHEVERNALSREDIEAVTAAVRSGQQRPGGYLDSVYERRARAYEWWACAYDEGWRPVSVAGVPVDRVDRVFLYVYSGSLARDRRNGAARPQRLPGVHEVRVAGRMLLSSFAWPFTPIWAAAAGMAWVTA